MSEIRRKLVIVGDGACGKVSTIPCIDPSRRGYASWYAETDTDGILVLRRNLDLLVDCLLERNFPRGTSWLNQVDSQRVHASHFLWRPRVVLEFFIRV